MNTKKEIGDNTSIGGKYKTIGELKNVSKRSVIQVVSRMPPSQERSYLLKWLFENYYLQKMYFNANTNLSTRITIINNKPCYNYIIENCFDGTDPIKNCQKSEILNKECKTIIKELHSIDPQGNGIFMDYLVRRIINEIKQENFDDSRANKVIEADKCIMENNKKLWQFEENDYIGYWTIHKEPDLKSKKVRSINLVCIQDGDRFIELDRKHEWLKIEYYSKEYDKLYTGWVRYLVPNTEIPTDISGNIDVYIPNKCFKEIKTDGDNHYCESGCKTKICYENVCKFPYCQNMCYNKVKNTKKYKTKDILKELYIVSCCHSEAFYSCPCQDKFDSIIHLLDNTNVEEFINSLHSLCNELLSNCQKILLNPCLYSQDTPVPSDCDVIIDDTLIDLKCSKNNEISEILQLLGYTTLLRYNKSYNFKIKNICIINLVNCEIKKYNIQDISDDNLLRYLNLLTNRKSLDSHNQNTNKKTLKTMTNEERKNLFKKLK